MRYPTVEDFYAADRRRGRSLECDYGSRWRDDEWPALNWRVSWVEATGELYVCPLGPADGPGLQVLGALPASGHPEPTRCDLVVQAVLAGWEARCGQARSLDWLRGRAGSVAGEQLGPLDWSAGCPSRRCPGHALWEPRRLLEHGGRCGDCGAPLVLSGTDTTAAELELRLRLGEWWHARRPSPITA